MNIFQRSFSATLMSLGLAAGAHAADNQPVTELLLPLCVKNECGIVDEQGTILLPFSKSNVLGAAADFKSTYFFASKGKFGLKNRAGEVLVAAGYDNMVHLSEGLLAASKKARWGIIDPQGRSLIAPEYDDYWYHEDAAVFQMQKGDRYALFDKSGRPFEGVESSAFIKPFDGAEHVSSGLSPWVEVAALDGQGSYLFNTRTKKKTPTYKEIYSGSNGHVLVENDEGLRTLLDAEGREIFPFKYNSLGRPRGDWIPFDEEGKYGFLDMKGKVVIAPKYASVGDVGKAGAVVAVATETGQYLYGVIDRKGAWALEPVYAEAGTSAGDARQVPVTKDGKVGVLDLDTLKWVLPVEYEYASTDGHFIVAGAVPPGVEAEMRRAGVKFNGPRTVGLFNHDGSVLVPQKYRMFNTPSESEFGAAGYMLAWNVQGQDQAVIDPKGKEIIGLDWPIYYFAKPGVIVGGWKSTSGQLVAQAYYGLDGKLLLQYKTDGCNQQQIVTGDGRVVWPMKLAKVCRK